MATNRVRSVLELGRLALRLVRKRVVRHGLRPANVVDADDQGLEVAVDLDRVEVERDQAGGDERDTEQGDLEVRVHDKGGSKELDVLALRVLDRCRTDTAVKAWRLQAVLSWNESLASRRPTPR